MLWKIITLVLISVFIFVLGLWLGSIQAEWASSEHSNAVAYLAMIGGWVSGIATSIAVIISLYATYQASQNNVEKLSLVYKPYLSNDLENYCANVEVKNLRPVTAHIQDFCIEISGLDGEVNISKLKSGGLPVKHSLHKLGEVWEFAFFPSTINSTLRLYSNPEGKGVPTFKKGSFIVKTTMNEYRLNMPKELLSIMKILNEKHMKISKACEQSADNK